MFSIEKGLEDCFKKHIFKIDDKFSKTKFGITKEIDKLSDDETQELYKKCVLSKAIDIFLDKPECLIGFLRIQSVRDILIQTYTQSIEIKLGDLLEEFFTNWFASKFTELKKKITSPSTNKDYKCDQLFEFSTEQHSDAILFIEQKIRDNHDSSKKVGQYENYEGKLKTLHELHPDSFIYGYEWFIDELFNKNKDYYNSEIDKLNNDCSDFSINKVVYGGNIINHYLGENLWDAFIQNYNIVKEKYKSLNAIDIIKNYDFDADPLNITFNILKTKQDKLITFFFKSELSEIRENLFPNNLMKKKLYDYFKKQHTKTGEKFINTYEAENNDK